MTEEMDKLKGRLDGMLRRWGGDEAARTVDIGRNPMSRRPRRMGVRWARVALAAAAGVVIAIGAVAFLRNGQGSIPTG